VILVDTSIWIDHLHGSERRLVEYLEADLVGFHPSVVEELALGAIRGRTEFLDLLERLRPFPVLTRGELMALVDQRQLWGRGLSSVDAHLIGSVLLAPEAMLWTRDWQLKRMAGELTIPLVTE
jgi:predicted nucleic acid-binding protein